MTRQGGRKEAKTASPARRSESAHAGPRTAPAAAIHRDTIVVGTSTGGLEALSRLLERLPADLPASVFIVLHTHSSSSGRLPEILGRVTPLKVAYAVHGEPIERGRVYVAPPDNHLMLEHGYLHVVRGPKENGHRPAVDPLFRSAARSYGARVVGVLLTGGLDCGTAGLMMIKAQGGITIVQDPDEALQPEMPRNALAHVEIDHVLTLARIGSLLNRLARTRAAVPALLQNGTLTEIEVATAQPADVACPSCGGVMQECKINGLTRFRCHTGHTFSLESLANEQARALEGALWAAVRALQESEALARRMANYAGIDMERRFEEKAEAMKHHASRIQRMLLGGEELTSADASAPRRRPRRKH